MTDTIETNEHQADETVTMVNCDRLLICYVTPCNIQIIKLYVDDVEKAVQTGALQNGKFRARDLSTEHCIMSDDCCKITSGYILDILNIWCSGQDERIWSRMCTYCNPACKATASNRLSHRQHPWQTDCVWRCVHGTNTMLTALVLATDSWSRHQMETFTALLALCAWNSPVTGDFPSQRPVMRSFCVFYLPLNKRLSKQSWGWWFETPSRPIMTPL